MKNVMLVPEEPHAVLIQIVLAMNAIETTPTSVIVELAAGQCSTEVVELLLGSRCFGTIECKFTENEEQLTEFLKREIRR